MQPLYTSLGSGSAKRELILFQGQLASYSVTAAIVAVAISTASDAQAAPVIITSVENSPYTPYPTPNQTVATFPLAPGPFNLRFLFATMGPYGFVSFSHFFGDTQIAVVTGNLNTNVAFNFGVGDAIEGHLAWSPIGMLIGTSNVNGYRAGNFLPPNNSGAKTGYIGFRKLATDIIYGWIRVRINTSGGAEAVPTMLTFVEVNGQYGAWDVQGGNLKVNPIPEPSVATLGGLALLALGARGVREMQLRKRAQRQEQK